MARRNYKTNNTEVDSKEVTKRKRNNASAKRSRNTEVDSEMKSGKFNDPAWYTRASDLTLNAGNFSFNNAAGMPLNNLEGASGESFTVPGIVSATYSMVPGVTWDNANSAVNLAARALYDKVNYKNSRNFSYDAPDLMMYVYGVSSCYALWAYMSRIYGVMNTYSVTNRYIPDALVHAMGMNPKEIRTNMADFLYHINMFARRVNALPVPDDLPLFSRYMWMPMNVWMDSESKKAGLFLYTPSYFWQYVENDTTGLASYLKPYTWGVTQHTLLDLYTMCNDLVEALLGSQDINNMGSDILKAYEGKIVQLPGIDPGYVVTPQYSAEVLQQFHNSMRITASTVSKIPTTGTWTAGTYGIIHQSNAKDYIEFKYYTSDSTETKFKETSNKILDAFSDSPSPEDVFVMTRFMFSADGGNIMSCGTEIINTMWVVYFASDGSTVLSSLPEYITTLDVDGTAGTILDFLEAQSHLTFFTNAPLTLGVYTASSTGETDFRIVGDLTNYTTISSDSLEKLHIASMLSLFSVADTWTK